MNTKKYTTAILLVWSVILTYLSFDYYHKKNDERNVETNDAILLVNDGFFISDYANSSNFEVLDKIGKAKLHVAVLRLLELHKDEEFSGPLSEEVLTRNADLMKMVTSIKSESDSSDFDFDEEKFIYLYDYFNEQ